jgi:cytochrome b involved in lipid metabolism
MKSRLIIILFTVFVLTACSSSPSAGTDNIESESLQQQEIEVQSESESATTTYTMAEVEANSSKESCYTIIDGKVYNITSYIPQHPGGERDIMKICGRDGSSMFGRQHGGDSEPEAKLQSLYIGELTE